MGVPISDKAQAFLKEVVFAHIATLMKDGSPHVTPVWADTDGEHIVINTSEPRQKARNMARDSRVALSIMGMENSQRVMQVRGIVKEITKVGANDHIDSLSLRYTGNPKYQRHQEGVDRVIVRIEPTRIIERL
ncbi:MAG: PPOX class F420-dependent oxidoreductase [Dehalococcoidia bacterium]